MSLFNKDKLFAELELWYNFKLNLNFDFEIINAEEKLVKLKELFLKSNVKEIFPTIFLLFRIYLIFPITNANAERSFSALKRLKTWLRNSMGQERLSSIALLNIESEEAEKLCCEKIVDEFALKKNRKLKFL